MYSRWVCSWHVELLCDSGRWKREAMMEVHVVVVISNVCMQRKRVRLGGGLRYVENNRRQKSGARREE